jgi:hypothetical protein
MPLFDEIDKKQRLQILRATYKSLEMELFELLARLGIDYDEYEFGSHPEFTESPDNYYKRRIIEIEAALSTLEAKIATLSE